MSGKRGGFFTQIRRQLVVVILICLVVAGFVLVRRGEHRQPLPVTNWLADNLARISEPQSDRLVFAVMGDNRDSDGTFTRVLQAVGADPEVAFVFDLGDLVNKGGKEEYRHFLKQVRAVMKLPFLTAVGNHETPGAGRAFYYQALGPYYYSFQRGSAYFIVIDNSTYTGLDPWQSRWLEEELRRAQACPTRLVLMHTPLFDPRGGDFRHCLKPEAARPLLQLLRRYGVTHIFASHIHAYYRGEWESIPFTITGGAGAPLYGSDPKHAFYHYVKVAVHPGTVKVTPQPVTPASHEEWERYTIRLRRYLSAEIGLNHLEMGLLAAAGVLLLVFTWRWRAGS